MLYSSAALAAFSLLPAVLAQNTTTAGSVSNTTTDTTTATTTASAPQSFPAPTVSGTSCGTTQQNFNQCVTKVAKDISSCPSTDNVCLCQTYANIAACYNGCPDLVAQGQSYQQQSTQYCAIAGVKPNTTATATVANTTSSSTTTPSTSSTTNTTRTNSTTAPVSAASTFAAKSNAPPALQTSVFGLTALVAALAAVFA